ncbi:MAG: glycosyltransferase, partial [Cyanobacteria bacterium P01_C01_bin.72]
GIGEVDPLTHLTARNSTIAYATTKETAAKLTKLGASNVQQTSETGISQAEIEQLSQCPPPSGEQVRFINVARLLHWKGIYLGLRAFAAANLTDAQYWVVGTGPERGKLEALAQELNIADRVTFFGLIDREEVLYRLGQCTALVHPSLHDSGGWVPLEAMASGRPILCLDLGGPGETVTSDLGIKVPAHNPEQTVKDLAAAMVKLAENPDLCVQMGQQGQQRIREFYSWEAKAQRLSDVYHNCVAEFATARS